MSVTELKTKYLRRLYVTLLVAGLLATFPSDYGFVRFLILMGFGMLAAWTDRAGVKMQRELKR